MDLKEKITAALKEAISGARLRLEDDDGIFGIRRLGRVQRHVGARQADADRQGPAQFHGQVLKTRTSQHPRDRRIDPGRILKPLIRRFSAHVGSVVLMANFLLDEMRQAKA